MEQNAWWEFHLQFLFSFFFFEGKGLWGHIDGFEERPEESNFKHLSNGRSTIPIPVSIFVCMDSDSWKNMVLLRKGIPAI